MAQSSQPDTGLWGWNLLWLILDQLSSWCLFYCCVFWIRLQPETSQRRKFSDTWGTRKIDNSLIASCGLLREFWPLSIFEVGWCLQFTLTLKQDCSRYINLYLCCIWRFCFSSVLASFQWLVSWVICLCSTELQLQQLGSVIFFHYGKGTFSGYVKYRACYKQRLFYTAIRKNGWRLESVNTDPPWILILLQNNRNVT